MYKLKLIEFIKNNPDWEMKLKEKPYCLSIKRDNGFIIFSYSMIDSSFSNAIVQECRGLILRERDLVPVCVPFFKFFNVQEGNAHFIDWTSAVVQEKLDGSLIKLWNSDDKWHVSTNGTIDARKAELQMPIVVSDYWKKLENYLDLFLYAITKSDISEDWLENLNKDYTYCFELVSPYNRIVVPYTNTELYHIGTRNNWSVYEEDLDIGFKKPKIFSLKTAEECLRVAQELPFSEEGWVVRDNNFNRIKIKSPAYVAWHHIRGDGILTFNKIINLIRQNSQDDYLSVFNEHYDTIKDMENKIIKFVEKINNDWNNLGNNFSSRKEFALIVNKMNCPSAIYSLWDRKVSSAYEFLWNQTNERILKLIE